jgi:signal transduction histidine kinase
MTPSSSDTVSLTIKTKIRLGLVFLLALILLLGISSSYYVNNLAGVSSAILKDNYESVEYTKNMIKALDQGDDAQSVDQFETNLVAQENNITERGEYDATRETRQIFELYKSGRRDDKTESLLRQKILHVQDLNMEAIRRKSRASTHTTEQVFIYLTIIGLLCFILSLTFVVRFPALIADPIVRNINRFEELDLAKTNFIATISHELKTPISSIKMSLQLMEDKRVGTLNEEQQKLLENIKEDSQRLLRITGELLNMAQVESGHIQLHIQPVRPEAIVNQAMQSAQNTADLKDISIDVKIVTGLPLVHADTDKTSWVLLNYLTNAIRYSKEHTKVIISVGVRDNKTVFSVQDFGRGIEEKYLPKVFDRYFQVPGTATAGSTGMGLAISREIIEKQGGTVSAESEYGSGSTFVFILN